MRRVCYTICTSTVGNAHLKPLMLVAVSSIAMLGLIVLLHRPEWYRSATPQPANLITALTEKALVESERDGDSDGLQDWEELLWKTDAHNADTDGDGTSDGNESGTGRDPTVAGPNDRIEKVTTKAPRGVQEGVADNSATAAVGKELLSKYFALKQSGGELDPEEARRLVESSISGLSETRAVRTYSIADMSIAESNNKRAIRDYGNAMGAIVTRYSPVAGFENEIVIFNRALLSDDKAELAKIDPILAGYRAIRDGALATPVPIGASVLHVRLVNALERYSTTLAGLRALNADPLVALLSLNAIQKDAPTLLQVIQDTERFFREQGIEYARGEDGYAFANALQGVQQTSF